MSQNMMLVGKVFKLLVVVKARRFLGKLKSALCTVLLRASTTAS